MSVLSGTERLAAALADRYRIERELGQGGMATVYLARDLKHDRNVAIKVLRPELADILGPERFSREIRLAARLNHPHILPVYDSGAAGAGDDAILYYVMPVMEGESLRDRLQREGRLAPDVCATIVTEVAGALDHAHRQGIVHRDIKPENILLHEGHALVADFGIGKAAADVGEDTQVTRTGFVLGTPAYMSPEQAMGGATDGRSDLFSLGCVLHEMLTGERPQPHRLMQVTPTTGWHAAIPEAMQRVLTRLLAADPDERVGTGAELIALLREPPPPAATRRAGDRSIAVMAFTNMSPDPEDEFFSDGIAEEIINALARLPGLRVAARTSAFSFKGRTDDARAIGEKLNVRSILEGSVRRAGSRLRITAQLVDTGDGMQLWSDRFDRELSDVFAIQDEIARTIATRLEIALIGRSTKTLVRAGTEHLEAYRLFLKGRALVNQRGPSLALGVAALEEAVALDPEYAAALAALANGLTLLGIFGTRRPEDALARARAMASRAIALDPDLAEARMASALLAAAEGDRAASRHEWGRAADLGPASAELRSARALWDLGYLRGDFDAAVALAAEAVNDDPLSAYARCNLALLHAHAGRPAEGVAQARRAVELDPAGFYSNLTLVRVLFYAGDFPEAIARGEATATAAARHVWIVGELAMGYGRAAKPDRAEALYRELLDRASREYVEDIWLAGSAEWAGRGAEAQSHLRRSAERRQPLFAMAGRHGFRLFVPQWESQTMYHELLRDLRWE